MSRRGYDRSPVRGGRRDYRSNSYDYHRRRGDNPRPSRRNLTPASDSEYRSSHRRDRGRGNRRSRSGHKRRSSSESDGVYAAEHRRRSDYRHGNIGSSRRYERDGHRRSRRRDPDKQLKGYINSIYEMFADIHDMVNDETANIKKFSGGRDSRPRYSSLSLQWDEKQSAKKILQKLHADAADIHENLIKSARRDFFEDLDYEAPRSRSPRDGRRKDRSRRGSRTLYDSDRDYSRRSKRSDRRYDRYARDDYDHERNHRRVRSYR